MNFSPADPNADTSLDALLGGRVRLRQPKGGLRAAIDPVFLAAAVPAADGDRVLEIGCGTGAAALCLAARVPGVRIVGLDVQADLIALACENAGLNAMSDRVSFVAGDLLAPPDAVSGKLFDHAMANPPYARAGTGRVSPDMARALAMVEGEADLAAWVGACAARVRAGGTVTFVHRADRAAEVAACFIELGWAATILPLGDKRALVQALRCVEPAVRRRPVFALHGAGGAFTAEAEAVLRHGAALSFGDACASA